MSQDDIVMFTLVLLFNVISIENGIVLPYDSRNLKQGIAQVSGTLFRWHTVLCFVLAGFIDGNICSAERNQAISRMKTVNVTDFTGDETRCRITYPGDTEQVRTKLIDIFLDLSIVVVNTALNVFQFFNGIRQLKGIAVGFRLF